MKVASKMKGEEVLALCLIAYLAGIMIWDYTLIYRVCLLAMFGLTFLVYRRDFFKIRTYSAISLLLFLYFAITTLTGFTASGTISRRTLITLLMNLCAVIAIEKILKNNQLIERMMRAWVFISLAGCIYIVIMGRGDLLSGSLGSGVSKPLTGGFYSHNDIALTAAFAVVFLSYFRVNGVKIRCNMALQLFFVCFIVLTGARKSLLLAVAGIVVYPLIFAASNKKNLIRLLVRLILVAAALGILMFLLIRIPFLYEMVGKRFEGYFQGLAGGEFTESSAISRSILKETALGLVRQKPIFGWGLDTFRTFPGSFGTWSHVNYLEIWVSGGIFAVAIYYAFYAYAIYHLFRMKSHRMRGLFLLIMLFMLVIDALSVTYTNRLMGVVYGMADSFIGNRQKEFAALVPETDKEVSI